MRFEAVQTSCSRLTYYQLNLFWPLTGLEEAMSSDREVSGGVALLFWVADFLSGTKLLDQDRIRLWAETFATPVLMAGDIIEREWYRQNKLKQLPRVKIGFLDRLIATMDGSSVFLNLETGQVSSAMKNLRPKETIMYDLGVLYAERIEMCNNQPLIPIMRERRSDAQESADVTGDES